MRQIIFRCDDAGSTLGAAEAIRRCVLDGVAKNVSVMAPGPVLEQSIEILQELADYVDFGLHVTLTSEWDDVRWGPVLPIADVPSLVQTDGTFWPTGQALAATVNPDEAEAEVRAQLRRLRELGLRVDYLDEHMGIGWVGELRERFHRIAADEGLLLADRVRYAEGVQTQDIESVLGAIIDAADQPTVIVFHPLTDMDPVGRRFTLGGTMPGEILRERAQDRRVVCHPRLQELRDQGAFASVRYSEVIDNEVESQ